MRDTGGEKYRTLHLISLRNLFDPRSCSLNRAGVPDGTSAAGRCSALVSATHYYSCVYAFTSAAGVPPTCTNNAEIRGVVHAGHTLQIAKEQTVYVTYVQYTSLCRAVKAVA